MTTKVLDVVIYPNDILRKKAVPVTSFDAKLSELAHNMIETMYDYRGIGLAANQVNVDQRIFVLDVSWRTDPDNEDVKVEKAPEIYVNPEILKRSGEIEYEEGCLSIPKMYALVSRSEKIHVRYQDLKGATHEAEFEGLRAIAFQHELDHLDGVMFFDRISPFKRRTLLEKFMKAQSEAKKQEA